MGLWRRRPIVRSLNPNRSQKALTASGQRIRQREGDAMRRLIQPWQSRALTYYDIVPEIKYAAQFYSRAMKLIRLYAAEMNDKGELVETKNEVAIEHLERIQDPGGGRSQLQETYGRLRFLTGESYLLVTSDPDTGEERWEMLSSDELRVTSSGYTRYTAPSMAAENLREAPDDAYTPLVGDEAVAYRLWNRHPRFSSWADATMQGVLDVCEELSVLSQAVRARGRSRLAGSGILLVNDSMLPVSLNAEDNGDDPEADPFLNDLIEAMMSPITDEGTASAVVPHVIRIDPGDKDIKNVLHHVQLSDPSLLYPEDAMRREARERLAIGLDMPPEVLLGIATANHWTGWLVDDQTWKAHLQPVAQGLADDLNSAYYRPTLREVGLADWERYYIAYDATAVINHPDRSKDAKDLHDRAALSDAALLEACGFTDEDLPTEEERNRRVGILIRDGSLAVYGIPSIRSGGIEPDAGVVETGQGSNDSGSSSNEVTKAPPEDPASTSEPTPGGVVGSLAADRILGASDLMLVRAREIAGARIRNYAKRDAEAVKAIDGVAPSKVAATLGQERVRALRAPSERELVKGGQDALANALRLAGLDEAFAEPLGERIEQHAARTLYDERPGPLPQTFRNYVAGLWVQK